MIKYDKEIQCGFDNLLSYCFKHPNGVYTLIFKDKKVKAYYDTMWEDDNGLELDDPNYEEYNSILFINVKNNESVPICYHDMPKEVWHDGKRIL